MPMTAPWPQTVIIAQKPHLSKTPADIRATFNDHEAIIGLGIGSTFCVPVVSKEGDTLGSLNFSGKEGGYTDVTVGEMERLAKGEAVDAFLAYKGDSRSCGESHGNKDCRLRCQHSPGSPLPV